MRISDWSSDVCSSDLGDIFVATTVLLESEWVLRSGYGFAPAQVADGLSGLAGLPGVTVEEPGLLARAIEWLRDGVDFADALHLAKAGDCDVFLSRSEEHTSELQSLMRISYAVFCLKK